MNLRDFCLRIFEHCPLFSQFPPELYMQAFSQFMAYKTRVPVRGAIMLDYNMEHVLLVKGWKKSASWSFPRGKINKDERDLDCAVREVLEETGFDIAAAGLVRDESEQKFIEVTMREQHIKLYVFRGVPTDMEFKARTRKEISVSPRNTPRLVETRATNATIQKIEWYKLSSLPGMKSKKKNAAVSNGEPALNASKLYMVAPFLVPLKRWIAEQRRTDKHRLSMPHDDPIASGYDTAGNDPRPAHDQFGDFEEAAQLRTADEPQQSMMESMGFEQPLPSHADLASNELRRMLHLESGDATPQPSGAPAMGDQSQNLLDMLRGSSGSQAYSQEPHSKSSEYAVATPELHQPSALQHWPPAFPEQSRGRRVIDPIAPFVQEMRQPGSFTSQMHSHHTSGWPQQHQQQQSQGPWSQQMSDGFGGSHAYNGASGNTINPAQSLDSRAAAQTWIQSPVSAETKVAPQPSASQLPPPQLSTHTRSLLDALKSGNKPSQGAGPSNGDPVASSQPPPGAASPFHFVPASVGPSRRSSAQVNSPPHGSPAVGQVASASLRGPPTHSLPPPDMQGLTHAPEHQPSSHQDALLKLFKAPAPANTPATASPAKPTAALPSHAIELPTSESASPAPQARLPPAPAKASTTPSKPLTILQRPKLDAAPASPPRVGSSGNIEVRATSAAATKSPRGAGRQQREHKHAQAPRPAAAPTTPVQILRRAADGEKKPGKNDSPKTATEEPVELKGSTPKPFQPQILKRPPPSPAGAHSIAPPAATASPVHAGDGGQSQRQALLSLFNSKKARASVEEGEGAAEEKGPQASPAAAAAAANPLAQLLSAQQAARKSSTTSQSGDSQSGGIKPAQTPISPSDRGFLMSYLEGMVKGSK